MQLTDAIGKPSLPPYWALGFHLCRTDTDMDAIKINVTALRNRDIPFDTDCGSAGLSTELFDQNSNKELIKYFKDLGDLNLSIIKPLIVQVPQRDQSNPGDPQWERIALRRPSDPKWEQIALRRPGDIYQGRFYNWKEMDSGKFGCDLFKYQFSKYHSFSVDINKNKSVIYPSFWVGINGTDGIKGTDELLKTHFDRFGSFDAIFLDYNTPLDLSSTTGRDVCPTFEKTLNRNNTWNQKFYSELNELTPCLDLEHPSLNSYNLSLLSTHNLYGYQHAKMVRK